MRRSRQPVPLPRSRLSSALVDPRCTSARSPAGWSPPAPTSHRPTLQARSFLSTSPLRPAQTPSLLVCRTPGLDSAIPLREWGSTAARVTAMPLVARPGPVALESAQRAGSLRLRVVRRFPDRSILAPQVDDDESEQHQAGDRDDRPKIPSRRGGHVGGDWPDSGGVVDRSPWPERVEHAVRIQAKIQAVGPDEAACVHWRRQVRRILDLKRFEVSPV